MPTIGGEARHGWQNLHDRGAAGADLAVTECRLDEDARLIGADVLVGNDRAEFSLALVAVLLHAYENVVDVDLDLFNQLDLEDDFVVDLFSLAVGALSELRVQVKVDTSVVLCLTVGQYLVAGEVSESGEDVL